MVVVNNRSGMPVVFLQPLIPQFRILEQRYDKRCQMESSIRIVPSYLFHQELSNKIPLTTCCDCSLWSWKVM